MILLVFIYGLLIGSFLNVLIYRIPKNESIVFPGSHCPICSHKLAWYDNVPLFSYLFLKGKCRYCGTGISQQYPLIESLNALIYIILFIKFGFSAIFIFYALVSSALIAIAIIDLKQLIIPDSLVISIIIITVLYKSINFFVYGISPSILDSFLGLLIAGGLFLAIVILSRGGMGGGDVTLIGALGFVLGVKYILLTIFLSFLYGAIISVFLLATKIKTRKDPIPFGPFIILSFFTTIFFAESLLNWYINLIS
ncbi:MAG: prepilin peptidase [Gudongella sp.]|nr:prepilin peptidase [Gudongella sp.]